MLSVGEILRNEREKKGLTLAEVEKAIKVREKFLHAIEQNDWKPFTSKIYITGIIKNYAHFLHLDGDKLTAFFRREYERKEEVKFKKRVSGKYFAPATRRYTILGIIAIFVIFSFYFGYQLYLFLSPPKVFIVSPRKTNFTDDRVTVIGKTEKDASIIIFGERVYQNKEGTFEYELPLHVGKNEFVAEVTGGNGKKTLIKKIFIRDKPAF
jgi:transcriptional regulator with XRE-family HTH domain